ncbi:MAG TPA: GNAT family N-acetyltransferase [Bacteroidia bacterium]|nr:GNAT family N-acetyltransferase [Bacteroidia bacterium]
MQSTLKLLPLNVAQIHTYAQSPVQLFIQLGLETFEPVIESAYGDFMAMLKDALINMITPALSKSPGFPLATHWLIIDESIKTCVGGIGAFPSGNRSAVIGYFIFSGFEGKGYATAAVSQFTRWLFEEASITTVTASIPPDHIASEKVLLKNGFVQVSSSEEVWFALYK